MRCEICNKSMTFAVNDGTGNTHWYCQDCEEIIDETVQSLEGDDEWYLEDLIYLEEVEGYETGEDEDLDNVPDWDEESA